MIRINKSPVAPAILTGVGVTQTNLLNSDYTLNPHRYTSAAGVKNKTLLRMKINGDIYGDTTVKDLLKSDQHQKCCFCEALFSDTSYGDVEHFRPKTAYKKLGSRSYVYPGYYWLAYDWTNLMFSCEKCNRTYKKNEFPLANEVTRKSFHNHANLLVNEDRLLVDPTVEDPSNFITFIEEVPVSLNNNLKGKKTIEILDLERLNDTRQNYLQLLDGLLAFTRINTEEKILAAMQAFTFTRQQVIDKITEANLFFQNAAKDSGKFAHCVRCKFPDLPTI